MTDSKLLQQISKKESDKETIAAQVIKKPELLSEIFAGLSAEQANLKYGCDKVLRLISKQSPPCSIRTSTSSSRILTATTHFSNGALFHTKRTIAAAFC